MRRDDDDAALDSGPLFSVYMGGRSNADNAATTYGVVPRQPGASSNSEWQAMHQGQVVGLAVRLTGDVGGAGTDYYGQLYINPVATPQINPKNPSSPSDWATPTYAGWTATGMVVRVRGDTGTEQVDYTLEGGVDYGEGDLLAVWDKKVGTLNSNESIFHIECRPHTENE